MNRIDLHVHSTKSDGTLTPTELVHYALDKGLTAMALTDHDTTEGIEEASAAAKNTSLCLIPGIEFSTEYHGRDIHIVGLWIDPKQPEFQTRIQDFINSRERRNQKMCDKLNEAGVTITYNHLMEAYPGSVITRSHYARYLLAHGYVKSLSEAFDRYIGDHASCFVPREKVTPEDAVSLILTAGGIPVLAHPTLYHMKKSDLEELVNSLKKSGLVAIETIYSTYSLSETREMKALADRHALLYSGGSDFHGSAKPGLDLADGYGHLYIHDDVLEALKKRHFT